LHVQKALVFLRGHLTEAEKVIVDLIGVRKKKKETVKFSMIQRWPRHMHTVLEEVQSRLKNPCVWEHVYASSKSS